MDEYSSRQKSPANRRRAVFLSLTLLVVVVIAVVAIYTVGRRLESSTYGDAQVRGDLSQRFEQPTPILYQDASYLPREGLLTILFMGIDPVTDDESNATNYRNGGQADFLTLLIIDSQNQTIKRLEIDRDTMADITTLGVFGNVSGTRQAQISLSHGFGDGKEQSCQFTVEAVQRLLYGINIDFYVSIDLDAIPLLNDVVGGVTVEIEDDFTAYDNAMYPGATVTLTDEQAELFVRSRTSIGEGTNAQRMRRQETFLDAFIDELQAQMSSNVSLINRMYDALDGYMVTNLKRGRAVNEANKAYRYQMEPMLSIAGAHQIGTDGFMEFQVDNAALEALVIQTFYTKAE